jgi:Na+/melibiose symporter-like transporter
LTQRSQTTTYACLYSSLCVLLLLYMCAHTQARRLTQRSQTTIYACLYSSYSYLRVRILVYTCARCSGEALEAALTVKPSDVSLLASYGLWLKVLTLLAVLVQKSQY